MDSNVSILLPKSKSKVSGFTQDVHGQKLTHGFIRAQRKHELLRELLPDDALIVAMDLSQKEHFVWMSKISKEPLGRLRIANTLCALRNDINLGVT